MKLNFTGKMPLWLSFTPWLVVICSILLASYVMVVGLRNAHYETSLKTRLLLERGTALINTLEGALRTALGVQWSQEELQTILSEVVDQPFLQAISIIDNTGEVVASSSTELIGTSFINQEAFQNLNMSPVPQWRLSRAEQQTPCFQVYTELMVPQLNERVHHEEMMGKRMRQGGSIGNRRRMHTPDKAPPLYVFVCYNYDPVEEARVSQSIYKASGVAVVVFLGLVGALCFFLVQAYLQSRRIIQESKAFSTELVRTLPVGLIAFDTQGIITTVNPVAEQITGETEALGKKMSNLWPTFWESLSMALQKKVSLFEEEHICTFGQRKRPLSISAARIVTEDNNHTGYALIMRDLGEIRQLQAELRHQERLAALGNMAAGIAHEIRNPLGAIKGLARYFQEVSLTESENARVASIMTEEVLRLDKVVCDLLELARPHELYLTPTSLAEVVERSQRLVLPDLEKVNVVTTIEEPSPLLNLDADRMTQVLINLLLNAVQSMQNTPEKSIRIWSETHADHTLLHITDTGCGMDENTLKQIFSPYFTTKAKGTGLGLSLVRKIMEAHNAAITVKSTPEQGTTFTLVF